MGLLEIYGFFDHILELLEVLQHGLKWFQEYVMESVITTLHLNLIDMRHKTLHVGD